VASRQGCRYSWHLAFNSLSTSARLQFRRPIEIGTEWIADILVGGSRAALRAPYATGKDAGDPQAKMPALQIKKPRIAPRLFF
jgi:hypothetical protein